MLMLASLALALLTAQHLGLAMDDELQQLREPLMGPGRRARLISRRHSTLGRRSDDPPPSWISINPLRDLEPLPKVHYNNQGIDGSYMTRAGHGPTGTSLEMLVDYARITGSFPALLDTAGTLNTAGVHFTASQLGSNLVLG